MRVLGLETSSRRGTVALLDGDDTVIALATDAPGGHAPHLLGLVERALAEAGWAKTALDRIAVGVGPGWFTGIRVGVALAQGIAIGLGRPIFGVGSLRAMSRGVPASVPGPRCALLDARRDELFCAEYDASGRERRAPSVVRRHDVAAWLATPRTDPGCTPVVVGEVADGLVPDLTPFRSELTDLPHAIAVALVAAAEAPEAGPADAHYVRPANAIRPNLPQSPLSSGKSP